MFSDKVVTNLETSLSPFLLFFQTQAKLTHSLPVQPVWSVTPNSYLIPKFAEHSTSSSLSPLHLVAPHCSNSSLAVAPRSPPPVLAVAPRCALLLQYSPSRRTPLLQSSPSSLSPLLVAGFASDNFSPLLFAVAPQTSGMDGFNFQLIFFVYWFAAFENHNFLFVSIRSGWLQFFNSVPFHFLSTANLSKSLMHTVVFGLVLID